MRSARAFRGFAQKCMHGPVGAGLKSQL